MQKLTAFYTLGMNDSKIKYNPTYNSIKKNKILAGHSGAYL
jgi:hypothetical protein